MTPSAAGSPPLVLVVEDEAVIRKFLRPALEEHGYTYAEAGTGTEGIAQASTRVPELVLLDLGLPDMDGLDVVRRIRSWSSLPIIVLTARGRERDKVQALDAGADDYVTKPFSMPELLARMRVALRHRAQVASGEEPSMVEAGRVRIDLARRQVTVDGAEATLTPIEFRLLAALARHAGRVLTHDFLLREVWGPSHTEERHYLRVYMAQLRQKLENDPARPRILLTETGVGYRMADES